MKTKLFHSTACSVFKMDVKIFRLIKFILHAMFFLLPCVETLKVIEIFVEQYCINCKGIEKLYIMAYFDVI